MLYAKVALGSKLEEDQGFFVFIKEENASQPDEVIMEEAAVKEFDFLSLLIITSFSLIAQIELPFWEFLWESDIREFEYGSYTW